MAGRKYPPRDILGMLAAGKQLKDNAASDPTAGGLAHDDITRLETAQTEAQAAFDQNTAAQEAAQAANTEQTEKIEILEDVLGELNGRVQPYHATTDTLRAKWGLPIYDKTNTTAPAPVEQPNVEIDTAMPLRHEINFHGENTKGKPDGTKALEIFLKIGGDATAEAKDYQYQAQDSDSPYSKVFDAADAGKQAHYLFCWVNSSGQRGPWRMASATITSEKQS